MRPLPNAQAIQTTATLAAAALALTLHSGRSRIPLHACHVATARVWRHEPGPAKSIRVYPGASKAG